MDTEQVTEQGKRTLRQAGTYVRENPIPTVLGALALGLTIGLAVRLIEREDPRARLRGRWDDSEEYLRSILAPLAKKSRRAYAKSAGAVREAVEDAVERARDIDVDEYTDPMVGWWRAIWKKCCG